MTVPDGFPRKVCVVITARPSYSRIKTAMVALRERPDVELQVVVAASALLTRYGDAVQVVRDDGFEPDALVYSVLEGESPVSMAKTAGLGIIELSTALHHLAPHVVVTVADRFETMSTAVAASYMNIPLAHVQGGEVTGSIDEKVRHAITKLADLHLVATEGAAERVRRLGEDPAHVHVTGCPSIDLAAEVLAAPAIDFDPGDRYLGVGDEIDLSAPYLVVLQHPVTTEYDDARAQAWETLHAVEASGLPALWFWPNVDAGTDGTSNAIRTFRERHAPQGFHVFKNMRPDDFLRVVLGARALVGNSSVGIRECSFLGVPVVNIGSRQRGRDRGANVVDVEHDRSAIAAAIAEQVAHGRLPSEPIYGDGRAGLRVAELLATHPLSIEKRITY